jgi:hypothetical protein
VADIRNKAALNKVYNLYKPQVVFRSGNTSFDGRKPCASDSQMLKEQKTWQIWCEYNVVKFVMVSTDNQP